MVLRIQEDGVTDIPIRAGETFFLPRVPHSPQRMPAASAW